MSVRAVMVGAFVCVCACSWLLARAHVPPRGHLDKYGPYRVLLNSPLIKCDHGGEVELDVSGIQVYWYDFAANRSESFPIGVAGERILNMEHLELERPWVMFIGGFTSHIEHSVEQQVRRAYRTRPPHYLLMPDHSQYTHAHDGAVRGYERAVRHARSIGAALARMWAALHRGGVNAARVHLVGHSLGGQVAGHAGGEFHALSGELIGRVSALDPAGPCFARYAPEQQVRAGLAGHVDVFHSNAGALGSTSLLGDADYLMNGGEAQPQCHMPLVPVLWDSSRAASCNHRAAVDLWTASVRDAALFPACREHAACAAGGTRAGAYGNTNNTGVYYISTIDYDLETIR